jgi:hypothetical protein
MRVRIDQMIKKISEKFEEATIKEATEKEG